MTDEIELYGAEISLYSGKTRAYLRYKRLPFREIAPTPEVIEGFLRPRTGLRMVPAIRTADDEVVQDTTAIMDFLEARHPSPPVVPDTPVQRVVASLLELYGDEWLLLPAMLHRWSHLREHLPFVLDGFGALTRPGWPAPLQRLAGVPMAAFFGLGHGPVLGLTRRTRPAVARTYDAFLDAFDAHLAVHRYLLGDRPTVADFGFMGPLYAHLGRDPWSARHMQRHAPRVADWVARMNAPPDDLGELLADDAIPETLTPILRHQFDEQIPVVRDTVRRVEDFVKAHPDRIPLPRFIGRHRFQVGGVEESRSVTPYTQWMWQRVVLAWRALDGSQRAALDALVGNGRATRALERPPSVWLERERGRMVPVPRLTA